MKKRKKNLYFIYLKELCLACLCSLLLVIVVSLFFFRWTKVAGYSMRPTLYDQDVVIIKKTKTVKRFDLILFDLGMKQQIRRVIGLPGEKIRYQEDTLYVNNEPIDEKFLVDEVNETQRNGRNYTEDFFSGNDEGARIIPEGFYLVLGDNRPYATDSRHYGLLATKNVIGRVTVKIFPINDIQVF
ncbi:signal peptidase I [Enterococcus sp. DIV0212c]|uniref:signal peptidase I n=1 Tax=Enterococcus sp. DIV0212c TaxID=2230867 RepID=UPI001A9C080E|nr:signal peptidase I [Enterococcus sp. DIV0212c]